MSSGPAGVVRFIHSADWQLGMTRHFLSAEAQARFSQDRIAAIERIGAIARERGAAFVVVSGDVFETNQVGPQTVRRACDALRTVPVPVFLLPGNHDPLDASAIFRSRAFLAACPPNVTVLDDATPRTVAGLPDVEILGAPWTSKRPLSDLVAVVTAGLDAGPGPTRVLVAHGATDDRMDFAGPAAIRVATAEAAIRDGRIAYLALGDRHSTTDVGSTGRIRYAGAPEPTDYDEIDSGNVLLVELRPDGSASVEPIRTGTWRFERPRFELDAGLGDLRAWLDGLPDKARTIVKLSLVGTITLSMRTELDAMLEHAGDLLGGLEQWERHTDLVVRPDADDLADLALTGFAATALERLRAAAAGEDEQAATARDALALLIRFVGGGAGREAAG